MTTPPTPTPSPHPASCRLIMRLAAVEEIHTAVNLMINGAMPGAGEVLGDV